MQECFKGAWWGFTCYSQSTTTVSKCISGRSSGKSCPSGCKAFLFTISGKEGAKMRKWLYVISIAIMVVGLIFYWIYTSGIVKQLQEENVGLSNTVSSLQAEIRVLTDEVTGLQADYDKLRSEYEVVVSGKYDVQLNEPTYEQVKESLLEMEGVKIEGNCVDRVKYVQDYFYDKGLQCYVVVTNYKGGFGHVTAAFNTEKGWVYVEPDGMQEIKIAVNRPYYIPMRAYSGKVGMTAQEFIEDNTVIQLVVIR
jgi:cell division protein FtsB